MRPTSGRPKGTGLYPCQSRVLMTQEMFDQLDQKCYAEGISACEVIRRALTAYLGAEPKPKGDYRLVWLREGYAQWVREEYPHDPGEGEALSEKVNAAFDWLQTLLEEQEEVDTLECDQD